jgi:hypothetical protein
MLRDVMGQGQGGGCSELRYCRRSISQRCAVENAAPPLTLGTTTLPIMLKMQTVPAVNTNNQRLRELVESAGLPQAVAMTVFNRGLGIAACPESLWKALFAEPNSPQFKPLSDEWLVHARHQFAKLTKSA